MGIPKPVGPPPATKRRRVQTPASYGLAEPVMAGRAANQPDLGFDAHPMVARMWAALGRSVEAKFFSHADWERAHWELWYADRTIRSPKISPMAWVAIQHALNDLLVSPADKRRAGIELKAAASDPDEDAAVLQMARYQEKVAE